MKCYGNDSHLNNQANCRAAIHHSRSLIVKGKVVSLTFSPRWEMEKGIRRGLMMMRNFIIWSRNRVHGKSLLFILHLLQSTHPHSHPHPHLFHYIVFFYLFVIVGLTFCQFIRRKLSPGSDRTVRCTWNRPIWHPIHISWPARVHCAGKSATVILQKRRRSRCYDGSHWQHEAICVCACALECARPHGRSIPRQHLEALVGDLIVFTCKQMQYYFQGYYYHFWTEGLSFEWMLSNNLPLSTFSIAFLLISDIRLYFCSRFRATGFLAVHIL